MTSQYYRANRQAVYHTDMYAQAHTHTHTHPLTGIGGADDDYSLDSLPQQKRSLSLNESTVMVFMRQVEVVLSDQPHTLFTVLLQDGCSRREAARTFLNLLCELRM